MNEGTNLDKIPKDFVRDQSVKLIDDADSSLVA